MKKVYLAAQTLAVGLEQVILDRAIYGGGYLEQFATTENKLAMVNKEKLLIPNSSHISPAPIQSNLMMLFALLMSF